MKQLRLAARLSLLVAPVLVVPLHSGFVIAAPPDDRVVVRDGVKHIVNPGEPLKPGLIVATRESWRCGGDDDFVLGSIGDVAQDRHGNTYLLDVQTSEIRVVDAQGKLVRTLGRQGEGPGEFQDANGMAILSDSVVCVVQSMPARIARVTVRGRAMGDHPLSDDLVASYLGGCVVVGNRLGAKIGQMIHGDTSIGLQTRLATLDSNGNLATVYWELVRKADFANLAFDEKADAEPVWAFSADARVFVNNNWDRYEIEVVGSDGKSDHVIERAYEHRRRPQADLDRIEEEKRKGEIHPDTKISPTSRDVVALFPRPDGSLWVLSSRGEMDRPNSVVATFDEFDRSGLFVRTVTVNGPRGPDGVFYLVGDVVFVVTGGERDVEVLCLRLADGP